ncbi:Abscisate beta-glucosyltransferase [Bienertia sinuspersici]
MVNALKELESLGCSFIWVLSKVLKSNNEIEETSNDWWLPNGFEESMKEKGDGLVIRGWAPQTTILKHEAIGGFLTHCGWNSILEGICGGVPLITWPMFADQFYNEKLVTQVLKIGVEVGNMVWKAWATDETEVVPKLKITSAITRVMGGGEEGEELRRKVKEFSVLAHKAVEEGGSSYKDIKALLHVLRLHKQDRISKESSD